MKKHVKTKLTALLIGTMTAVALTACGGSGGTKETSQRVNLEKTSAAETAGTTAEETQTAEETTTEARVFEGTPFESPLFSLTYADDWTVTEKDQEVTDTLSRIKMSIMEGDKAVSTVSVKAELRDPETFRDKLVEGGIDAYDVFENNKGSFEKIGGLDFLSYENSFSGGTKVYLTRVENAKESIFIEITGAPDEELVSTLLDSIRFTTEDIGHMDPPWPWNGEPIVIENAKPQMVGTYTLEAVQIPIDESLTVNDIFKNYAEIAGDTAYTMSDGRLHQYSFDGTGLTFQKEVSLGEDDYRLMTMTADGTAYVSGGFNKLISVSNGTQTAAYDSTDLVTVNREGTKAIAWFVKSDMQMLTLSDGTLSSEAWTAAEIDTVSSISVSQNHIFVSGKTSGNGNQGVAVYNLDGSFVQMLGDKGSGDPESLGSVTAMVETGNGFLGIDGNLRNVILWKSDGTYIGSTKAYDLFGVKYPWISSARIQEDGSIIVTMSEERPDKSADELIVFKLTGF